MKILHIATDEKFINSMSWQFEKMNNLKNYFIILLESIYADIKYVKLNNKFKIVEKNKEGLDFCLKEIIKYDLVIFHGLNYFQSRIILNTPDKSKLIWFFWGGEFYDNPNISINTIGDKTKNYFIYKTFKDKIKKLIRPLFYYISNQSKTPEQNVLDAAKQINHFGILYKQEMDYFKSLGLLSENVSQFKMTYYPLEYIFKGIANLRVHGQNILIGNSASYTNNHLETFDFLKDINLGQRKIIVPLSYGDSNYGQSIKKIGESIFKQNIMTVFNFMPLYDFNTLLASCNVVIMNHYRQQALGNIMAVLWMGAKVYLNESNTLYHYLKRIGITIFSINKDWYNNPNALDGLKETNITNNRKILIQELGFDALKKSMSEGFKDISANDH